MSKFLSLFQSKKARCETDFVKASDGDADYSNIHKHLNAKIKKITKQYLKDGLRYIDTEFPSQVVEEAKVKRHIRQWLAPCDISVPKSDQRHRWNVMDNASAHDVIQGHLGNCWLIGAMATLATKEHLLDKIFATKEVSPVGVYGLLLYIDGEWVEVIIDELFPCDDQNEFVFAKSNQKKLWVPLLEKAMAKLFGGYSKLQRGFIGQGLIFMTGCCSERLLPGHEISIGVEMNDMHKRLEYAFHNNFLVCAATKENDEISETEFESLFLASQHAYTMLAARVIKDTPLVFMRNVWGKKSWTGDWSPSCLLWRSVPKNQYPKEGTGNDCDGTFWIAFSDICRYFREITICYARKNYHEYHIASQLPRCDDMVWETFEMEVLENSRADVHLHHRVGASIEEMYYHYPILIIVYNEEGQIVGASEGQNITGAIWTSSLICPGKYKIFVLSFGQWEVQERINFNFDILSSRKLNCWKNELHISKLGTALARVAVSLGKATQLGCDENRFTMYELKAKFFSGKAILVVNRNPVTYLRVTTNPDNIHEDLYSTRAGHETVDIIPPECSQIVQLLVLSEDFPNFAVDWDKVGPPKPNDCLHCPPLSATTRALHGIISNNDLK